MSRIKMAIDSDIFFFCIESNQSKYKSTDIRRILQHLSHAPYIEIYVPISVLGESVIQCLSGEIENGHHNLAKLHDLIDLWGSLDLMFLYPNELVADACYQLVNQKRRGHCRLSHADLVHLGYALAYKMDYFLSTDSQLTHSNPDNSGLIVIPPPKVKDILAN